MKSATKIGLFAGLVTVLMSLAIYYWAGNFESQWQIVVYGFYCGSVMFAQHKLQQSSGVASFKELFTEGFRTFVVVTLIMVAFTWIFLKTNPDLQKEILEDYRKTMVAEGNRTMEQIQTELELAKEKYLTFFTSLAIFGYLIIGSLAALIGGIFFSSRNNK